MASVSKSVCLLLVILATCSARSVDLQSLQNDLKSLSGSLTLDTISEESSVLTDAQLTSRTDSSPDSSLGKDTSVGPNEEVSSSPAAILQAQATAEAIAEEAAAKTLQAKIAIQTKMYNLRMSTAQANVLKTNAEADSRARSASIHLSKAKAAGLRKIQDTDLEAVETAAATRDEAIAEQLRESAKNILQAAQEEAAKMKENITQLEREAAVHQARAESARSKADAAAAAAGLHSLGVSVGSSPYVASSWASGSSTSSSEVFI